MDFERYNPFNPTSPEGLIFKFRLKHCSRINYSQYDPRSEAIVINDSSFTLPIDDYLRSVSEYKPINRYVLSDGPHVYIRDFIDAQLPDDRELAKRRAVIAQAMLSETSNAMGVLANFIEFARSEVIYQAIAERRPVSRVWETSYQGAARWKGYWKNIRDIEVAFKAVVAIHEIAREKLDVSRVSARPGPKQRLWKYDLAFWLGHLWFALFSNPPSPSPDGRFAEFVESLWASVDPENLHPQNWDRTIRQVANDLKHKLNQ